MLTKRARGCMCALLVAACMVMSGLPATATDHYPPDVTMHTHAGSQRRGSGNYCWPWRTDNYKSNVCADSVSGPSGKPYLRARRGEAVRFHIDYRQQPDSMFLHVSREVRCSPWIDRTCKISTVARIVLRPSTQTTWRPRLPDGKYDIMLAVDWDTDPRNGRPKDAAYDFQVDIRGAMRDTLPRTGVSWSVWGWVLCAAALALAMFSIPERAFRRARRPFP